MQTIWKIVKKEIIVIFNLMKNNQWWAKAEWILLHVIKKEEAIDDKLYGKHTGHLAPHS